MKRKTILVLGVVAALGATGAVAVPAIAGGGCGPWGAGPGGGWMGGPGGMPGPMMHGMRGPWAGPGPANSAMFRSFDANEDGTVSPDEVQQGVAALHTKHDADGDGVLSAEEFGALFVEVTKDVSARPFTMLDADGNGQISLEEMAVPARMMATWARPWFTGPATPGSVPAQQ